MYGIPERRLPDCKHSSYFLRYASNITSQGGEDGILNKIFEFTGISADDNPFCIDIGAWDGKHLSNTYNLIHENKWSGLLIEANTERFHSLSSLYSERTDVLCLNCLVDVEGDDSLINIFMKHNIKVEIDFLSIDIDGADYHIWNCLKDSLYHPRVVCIEFNPTIQNHVYYVQDKDVSVQEGSSLLAISELGYQLGYQIVATTTFNAIFIRYDLLIHLPEKIFTYQYPHTTELKSVLEITTADDHTMHHCSKKIDLNSLHVGSMVTDLFQTYSGELKLCGPKKLLWHRIPMNIQQMQAIKSKKDRIFPFAPQYNKFMNILEEINIKISSLINDLLMTIVRKKCITVVNDMVVILSTTSTTSTSDLDKTHYPISLSLEQMIADVKTYVLQLIEQCNEIFGIKSSCYEHDNVNNSSIEKKPLQGICTDVILRIVMIHITSLKELSLFNNNCNNNSNNNSNNSHNNNEGYIPIIEVLFRDNLTSLSFCMEKIGDKQFELYRKGAFHSKKDNIPSHNNPIQLIISVAKNWYLRSHSVLFLANMYYPTTTIPCATTNQPSLPINRVTIERSCSSRLDEKISHCYLLLAAQDITEISQHKSAEDLDNICQGLYWFHIAQLRQLQDLNQGYEQPNSIDKLEVKWLAKLLPTSIYTNKIIKEKLQSSRIISPSPPPPPFPPITNRVMIKNEEDNECTSHSNSACSTNYYNITDNTKINNNNTNITTTTSNNKANHSSFYSGFILGLGVAFTCGALTYAAYSKHFKANK